VNRRRFLVSAAALPLSSPLAYAAAGLPVPTIVCFGDSITAGYGADPGHSYPDYLQADLDTRGYRYRVVNQGISGNTTKDGVSRLQDVLEPHPAVVIVEFGGNDGLRGLPITATRGNLDTIVRSIHDAGIKVILCGITLPPNYGQDYIRQFDAIFPEAAAKYHAVLLPMLYANVYNVPGAIQQDGIHPTAKGAQLIAQNLLPLLLPLLHQGLTAKR
jgi:acyl-CoA thioesterase I